MALKRNLQLEKERNRKLNSELESCRTAERRASSKAETLAENFELSQKMAVGFYVDRQERRDFISELGRMGKVSKEVINRLGRVYRN